MAYSLLFDLRYVLVTLVHKGLSQKGFSYLFIFLDKKAISMSHFFREFSTKNKMRDYFQRIFLAAQLIETSAVRYVRYSWSHATGL